MTRQCRWSWDCSTKSMVFAGRCAACATRSNSTPPRAATRPPAPCRPAGEASNADRGRPRPPLTPLQLLKPRPGAAFDAGGDQPLDVESGADQFEAPQFLLAGLAIGGRDIAGNCVGGLAQFRRQCL